MGMQLQKDRVYLVESPTDQTVKLALGTHVFGDELRWFDTVRGRTKKGRVVSDTPQELVWQAMDGVRYRFTELTLEKYNRDIRPRVERSPGFPTVDEMHRFYVRQFGPLIGLPPPPLPPLKGPAPAAKKPAAAKPAPSTKTAGPVVKKK